MVRRLNLSIAVQKAAQHERACQLDAEPHSPITPDAQPKSNWFDTPNGTTFQTPTVSFKDVAAQGQGHGAKGCFETPTTAPVDEAFTRCFATPVDGSACLFGAAYQGTPQPRTAWSFVVSPGQEGEEEQHDVDFAPSTPRQSAPYPRSDFKLMGFPPVREPSTPPRRKSSDVNMGFPPVGAPSTPPRRSAPLSSGVNMGFPPSTPPRRSSPYPSTPDSSQDWLGFQSKSADFFPKWGEGGFPWESHGSFMDICSPRPPPPPVKVKKGCDPGYELFQNCDPNEGRFRREFCEVARIGSGDFGTVFRARHKIDQQLYAVKVHKAEAASEVQTPEQEVRVLAAIANDSQGCPNLVRYFSSWKEDGFMHMQTELCECSLRDRLNERKENSLIDPRFGKDCLVQVIGQVATGLATLHRLGFAHLDIKPDNLLVGKGNVYKIADLGLATPSHLGRGEISDGDCRYLAKELLTGVQLSLPQADIFSLGLVSYELATLPKPLPMNGEQWQSLRDGILDCTLAPELPTNLWELLCSMVSKDPTSRPSSSKITVHPSISSMSAVDELLVLREELRKARQVAEESRQAAEALQSAAARHQLGK